VTDRHFAGSCNFSLLFSKKAAHCFQKKNQRNEVPVTHPTKIVVKLGKHDLSILHERGSETIHPNEIIIHPDWKTQEQRYNADLALLIFETEIKMSATIIPICLDYNLELENIESGFVVGWGKSESAAKHENTPKQLEVLIHSNEQCLLSDIRFHSVSSTNTFCAGKDSQSSPCYGDSGSGMFVKLGTGQTARWYLRGLVSAAFIVEDRCDTSVDVLFTNLFKFAEWLSKTIAGKEISSTQPLVTGPFLKPETDNPPFDVALYAVNKVNKLFGCSKYDGIAGCWYNNANKRDSYCLLVNCSRGERWSYDIRWGGECFCCKCN
jgi:secreted trypsin-like serine protease